MVSELAVQTRISNDIRFAKLFGHCDTRLLCRFMDYHKLNPDLYKLFEKYADEAKGVNRSRFSIWMIANRIRWYTQVETSGQEFKVSNDYLALYARLLIYLKPEFEGFFQLKTMKPTRGLPKE